LTYGGAAGGRKTVGLLLEPLRYVCRAPNFTLVFFRRTMPQITNPGGRLDESQNIYSRVGGTAHLGAREWRWRHSGKTKFSHLQYDSTVYDWQGAQITLICFDELTHFLRHQFFYMLSRNRSTGGVPPYIRATCNPDADSWGANFLAWWIDPATGFPVPERAGVLRYYVRVADKIEWADRPEDLMQHLSPMEDLPSGFDAPRPISVTFIPASVFDNPALLQVKPEYVSWLRSLPLLECERLLAGHWKIRPAAGFYFKREWCGVVDEAPAVLDHIIRYWDLPAIEKTEFKTPIGRSASSLAAIEAAATGLWIWCGGAPIREMSSNCCSILPGRTATDPHWIRPGPGTGRQEPDAPSPCPRPRRPATC
jgi:hypothetical protein